MHNLCVWNQDKYHFGTLSELALGFHINIFNLFLALIVLETWGKLC